MVVQEQTLYAIVTAIALVATVVATILLRRHEQNARRHIAVMVVSLGLLTAGYGVMALDLFVLLTPDGEPVYLSRFALYTVTYTFIMSYVGLIAGASLRYRLVPAIATLGFTYGTLIVQMAPEPFDSLGTLIVLVSLVTVLWAFYGPLTRAARSVSGNRRLLFAKLRNLGALIFLSYLLLALMTRQALGLFDAFVGVFLAAYVDLLAHLGLVGLIVYSRETIDELSTEYSSPLATFTAREEKPESNPEPQPADD
jgi:bacteriorhodopsin